MSCTKPPRREKAEDEQAEVWQRQRAVPFHGVPQAQQQQRRARLAKEDRLGGLLDSDCDSDDANEPPNDEDEAADGTAMGSLMV